MKRIAILAALAAGLFATSASAQDYPNKPIHVLTTSSAGGISDIFMRVLGDAMRSHLNNQPLIIENRPGAAGGIAARACQEAAAGRLYHLHHQCRYRGLQPVPVQKHFRTIRTRSNPDRQPVPPDPGAGDQLRSQGEDGRRTGRGVEAEGGNVELPHRVDAACRSIWRASSATRAPTGCACRSRAAARRPMRSCAARRRSA